MAEPFSGVILAGGASRRFGSDKALAQIEGKTFLERVWASLADASERFVVSDRPYPPYARRPDLLRGQGPIGGVATALWGARFPWVAIAACDMPYLEPAYWQWLAGHRGPEWQAVAVENEPLAAFWHRSALPAVLAASAPRQALQLLPTLWLPRNFHNALTNCNRPLGAGE